MNNNTEYDKRMESSMNYKIEAIKPWLKEGCRVLDYGCGKSSEIRDLVKKCGGSYYLGIDKRFQYPHRCTSLDKYGDITFRSVYLNNINQEIDGKFDVIFMSSVIHEMQSFMTRKEFKEEIGKLCSLLEDDGYLIVRDWPELNDPDYDSCYVYPTRGCLSYRNSPISIWSEKLELNGIRGNLTYYLYEDGRKKYINMIGGPKRDILNLAYHVVWGMKSIDREADEDYRVNYSWVMRVNGMKLFRYTEEHDENYKVYLDKYFENYEEIFNWAPTKEVIVWKKGV